MRRFYAAVLAVMIAGMVTAATTEQTWATETKEGLAQKVVRLHIVANSNTNQDQKIKLKVRDAVIKDWSQEREQGSDAQVVPLFLSSSYQAHLQEVAQSVVEKAGIKDRVQVTYGWEHFPRKTYGEMVLPSGYYRAVKIVIGSGEGHNWWCCLYPNLCFVQSVKPVVDKGEMNQLQQVLTEDEYQMVTVSGDFHLRSNVIEYLRRR